MHAACWCRGWGATWGKAKEGEQEAAPDTVYCIFQETILLVVLSDSDILTARRR